MDSCYKLEIESPSEHGTGSEDSSTGNTLSISCYLDPLSKANLKPFRTIRLWLGFMT